MPERTAAAVALKPAGKRTAAAEEAERRRVVRQFIVDYGHELGDKAPRSSTTRALHLMEEADVNLTVLVECMRQAKLKTQKRSGTIHGPEGDSPDAFAPKNKMPFFFAVLRDELGLKEAAPTATKSRQGTPARPSLNGLQRP